MKLQISSRIAIFALMELATRPERQLAGEDKQVEGNGPQ